MSLFDYIKQEKPPAPATKIVKKWAREVKVGEELLLPDNTFARVVSIGRDQYGRIEWTLDEQTLVGPRKHGPLTEATSKFVRVPIDYKGVGEEVPLPEWASKPIPPLPRRGS